MRTKVRASLCLLSLCASACTGLKGSEHSRDGGTGDAAQGAGDAESAVDGGIGDGALPGRGRPDASTGFDAAIADSGAMHSDTGSADGAAASPDAAEDAAPDPELDARIGNAAPTATIEFPLQGRTDAETITVRGVVNDPDGDAITSVTVEGATAVLESDGNFSLIVRLEQGVNVLEVQARDALGASSAVASVTVERAPTPVWWRAPTDVAIDPQRNEALVVDPLYDKVFAVELSTGRQRVIADPATDFLISFSRPSEVEIDVDGDRAFVVASGALFEIALDTLLRASVPLSLGGLGIVDIAYDGGLYATSGSTLYEIQLPGGQARMISDDADTSKGPVLGGAGALAIDAARQRAYLAHVSDGTLKSIVLGTGDRRLFAGGPGADPSLTSMHSLTKVGLGEQLLAGGDTTLHSVARSDGAISILAGDTIGSGIALNRVMGLGVDQLEHRALAASSYPGARFGLPMGQLVWIDLETKHRTPMGCGVGTGAGLVAPVAPVVDEAGHRLLLADKSAALLAVDLDSGSRLVLSDDAAGGGPRLRGAGGMSPDLPNQRVFVVDSVGAAVFSVNPISGDRTVISDNAGKGAGPAFTAPGAILFDAANQRLLVLDSGRLMSIDLAAGTGNRLVLSDASRSGPSLDGARALVFGAAPDTLLVAVGRSLLAIDLASGNRSYVNEGEPGGTGWIVDGGLVVDGDRWFAIFFSETSGQPYPDLIATDLATGARTIVSGPSRGSGPFPADMLMDAQAALMGRVLLATLASVAQGGAVLAIDTVSGDRVIVSM